MSRWDACWVLWQRDWGRAAEGAGGRPDAVSMEAETAERRTLTGRKEGRMGGRNGCGMETIPAQSLLLRCLLLLLLLLLSLLLLRLLLVLLLGAVVTAGVRRGNVRLHALADQVDGGLDAGRRAAGEEKKKKRRKQKKKTRAQSATTTTTATEIIERPDHQQCCNCTDKAKWPMYGTRSHLFSCPSIHPRRFCLQLPSRLGRMALVAALVCVCVCV